MAETPLRRSGREREFEVGQVWRLRSSLPGVWRFRITRLARRTAFGDLTVSTLDFGTMKGQKRYTQLRAKWELER